METTHPSCFLCHENLSTTNNEIKFTCGHIFCDKCFPYILFYILDSQGIHPSFFTNPASEYPCLICKKGKSRIPFENILASLKKQNQDLELRKCEEDCGNMATLYCEDCDQYYCDECNNKVHISSKKFMNHKSILIDQSKNIIKSKLIAKNLKCHCPSNQSIELFCLACSTGLCKYCALTHHEKHEKIHFSDAQTFWQKVDFAQAKQFFHQLAQKFQDIKTNLLEEIHNLREKQNNELNELMDRIIKIILEIKERNHEKSLQEAKNVEIQLSLIEECLEFLKKDLEVGYILPPNKLLQICNFFPVYEKEKKMSLQNFCLEKLNFEDFLEFDGKLNTFLQNIETNKKTLLNFSSKIGQISILNSKFISNDFYELSTNDPLAILQNPPLVLHKENFCPKCKKSNVSCSFTVNSKWYLSWAGCLLGSIWNTYPLYLHNLSTNQKNEQNLTPLAKENQAMITVVNTYPQQKEAKWLYCGDMKGVIRMFEVSTFKEICRIETEKEKAILAAVVFEDKFDEIKDKSFSDQSLYILVSLEDENSPLKIYNLQKNFTFLLLKEIKKPVNKMCYSLNYFHDELQSKTQCYCGFSNSFIKSIDLKTLHWESHQFETQDHVTSINFVLRLMEEPLKYAERSLIYTQMNSLIVVADVDSGKTRKKNLEKSLRINDLKVCKIGGKNETRFILIVCDTNWIKLINFENFEVLKSIETPEETVGLVQALRLNEKNKEKQCMITFIGSAYKSQIGCFEEKV